MLFVLSCSWIILLWFMTLHVLPVLLILFLMLVVYLHHWPFLFVTDEALIF